MLADIFTKALPVLRFHALVPAVLGQSQAVVHGNHGPL
jgi:hypothetical protein